MLNDVLADRRLLLVHAHPDDESSQSAATMARYVAEGAQVTLVTCTLGELGEILVPDWAHFTPGELGGHRQGEIAVALAEIGVTDHVYLGGAGRYHDSGMARDEKGADGHLKGLTGADRKSAPVSWPGGTADTGRRG